MMKYLNRRMYVIYRKYHSNVIDHYENPKNVGSLNKHNKDVGSGLVGAPACGDVMKFDIRVDDTGVITESKLNNKLPVVGALIIVVFISSIFIFCLLKKLVK